METRSILLLSVLIFPCMAIAQLHGEAPEIWSQPVLLQKVGNWPVEQTSVFVVPTNDTMYFLSARIYRSVKSDSGWLEPILLNDNVNGALARYPSASPDGRRLYFADWRNGEWDFWYSNWNDSTRDWGPAANMGVPINNFDYEWSCHQVDTRRLYFHRYGGTPWLSIWDSTAGWWGVPTRLDTLHFLGIDAGISVRLNGRKVYQGIFTSTSWGHDLYVSYYDTLNAQWSFPKRLNISVMMDTTVTDPYRRAEGFPSISPNGTFMYFIASLNGPQQVWTSRLLFDENGDPVSVGEQQLNQPKGYRLDQNYPNPFNPTTTIVLSVPRRSTVSVKVFDLLGRELETLISGQLEAGKFSVQWNAQQASSGVYFYKLQADGYVETKRMLLMK
jgi:hypothetical protein